MKKPNSTQRASRARAFSSMTPRGTKRKLSPHSPWRHVFPITEPKPIVQEHAVKGARYAVKLVPVGEPDKITGKYPTDEQGRVIVRPVHVCLHRCTHINMRHGAKRAA